jgi:molybdopterin synthase catalytic subunit
LLSDKFATSIMIFRVGAYRFIGNCGNIDRDPTCLDFLPMNSIAPTLQTRASSKHPDDDFRITFAPLLLEEVYSLADDGAIVLMSGMVRNQTNGMQVQYLEYQAYEPMALKVFEKIAAEIRQTWTDVTHVVIHHRTGKLEIGEISVLIAVGCPHRGEAFAACQYAIDQLKHQAPIWKKEHASDGSSTWATSAWVSIGACEQANC